ncbi:MAG TPA: glycine cleavage system aminomethyltransferase GcvT [Thermoleophilia bacterium]|nr:glycine cleavage system aminomethyltransferase GcvT [Thermoleophilia bacterium]
MPSNDQERQETATTDELRRTALFDRHVEAGGRMVDFAGWEMPLQYTGIVAEHLATRRRAGLFDVSHMGRFIVGGAAALAFLQHVLTNNAAALEVCQAQYTIIADEHGGAIDDAYLYRFSEAEYLLVVNAANRVKDWTHFTREAGRFVDLELRDATREIAMVALQGPDSRDILAGVLDEGRLPEPLRNECAVVRAVGESVRVGRTGYTGEPLCFELFVETAAAPRLWDALVAGGAQPAGLGARDTLRLEAGLPLYGFELGLDDDGAEIPIFAIPLAKLAVSLSPLKGDFVGRAALARQHDAFALVLARDFTRRADLPRLVQPVAVAGRGVARTHAPVYRGERRVGYVTSGTSVPYWVFTGRGLESLPTEEHAQRSIALAYLDCDVVEDDEVTIDVRGTRTPGLVVPFHLRSDAPPFARPIVYGHKLPAFELPAGEPAAKARLLLGETMANTAWRQSESMNLIPSEMTTSPLVRLASIADPAFRYGEHRRAEAFYDDELFYYQGTDFIASVEQRLEAELCAYLGCAEAETRLISGQMANMAVFSALVEYGNRADPKAEPRRIAMVMNNHIGKGGHLSAQPMGALRDFVARDPRTDAPAVVNFPVRDDNPYRIDVAAAQELIARWRPRLIVFGRSMVLHPEPVAEIRRFLSEQGIDAVVLYDMAHVLGLIGPHFQEPFADGADLVTGSTHKTFFGPQRGVVGSRFVEPEERYQLWEALRRRAFPGSVSNHHLGTLLGLLFATYEMRAFRDTYQPRVIANAKAFAGALAGAGLDVQGDPAVGYTETHQVVLRVGYGRGHEMATRLEENNIVCNYQGLPDEEAFTAAGGLRLGVAEMTRFGMGPDDFGELAELMADVVLRDARVANRVRDLRRRFVDLHFCFSPDELGDGLEGLAAFAATGHVARPRDVARPEARAVEGEL